ncbi:MAG TPA: cation diffusion facilitator family transporter [Gemmatimonadales bacterium]|jgi:cobalt-zinc-cadmium efflux system protein
MTVHDHTHDPGHAHSHEAAHTHAHGLGHHHGGSERALFWALWITIAFMFIEAVGGFVAHSLALLADAAHMLTDAAALGLALFAAWVSRRPAGAGRTWGWLRAEILAALVNAVLLFVVTIGIIYEAVQRLMHPEPVEPVVMFWVATAGLVAGLGTAAMLFRSRGEDLNIRGAYLHVLSDLAGAAAAMLAAVIIRYTGFVKADPLLSILLSILLLVSSGRLLWQAVDILLEAAPRHIDVEALQTTLAAVPGIERVHDVHVWTVSSGMVAMSGHCVVLDPAQAQSALNEITRRVKGFGIGHVTVQLENGSGDCVGCEDTNEGRRGMGKVGEG